MSGEPDVPRRQTSRVALAGVACAFVAVHFLVFFAAPFGGGRPVMLTWYKFNHDICVVGTCTRVPTVGVLCAEHAAADLGRIRRSGVIAAFGALVLTLAMTGRLLRRFVKILARRDQAGSGKPKGAVAYVLSQLVGPSLASNIAGWVVFWGMQPF